VGGLAGAVASVEDMTAVSAGDGYGLYGAGSVEKDNDVGGSGWSEKLFNRKDVGVPNGEGRSGSILRFALSDVRKAIIAR
jgi:hypothetical protein